MPRLAQLVAVVVLLILANTQTPTAHSATTPPNVTPTGETDPMPHDQDAADDPAIWIHPSDPSRSTVIGTDKRGGLAVYDLSGRQLQYLTGVSPENVDIRYNFPLGGRRIDLVTMSDKRYQTISAYEVNPDTRQLTTITARRITVGISVYGSCMYRSPFSGKYYTFITKSPYSGTDNGEVQQWELFDNGGKVDARKVRTFLVGSNTEGCVADDMTGALYISQTRVGIWRYSAEPQDGSSRVSIDQRGNGRITGELEGISLYYTDANTGYLVVSHQGSSEYLVYRREGTNSYLKTFKVGSNSQAGIDNVTYTDGLDVTNVNLGPLFPQGVFVVQDGQNKVGTTTTTANTNFKLVPWQSVASVGTTPLSVNTGWNPRQVGANTPPPTATPTPTPPTPTSTPTATPSATPSTPTSTPTATPSATPSTPTNTPTATPSATPSTNTPTATPSATPSTPTSTPTATPSTPTPSTPTPSPGTSTSLTILASADARVEMARPTTNFGTATTIRVDGGGDPAVESYLRFSVGALSQPIVAAKVRVYVTTYSSDGPAIYIAGDGWSENVLNWNNRPVRSGSTVGDKGRVSSNTWVEYDVSAVVTASGSYSFVLATGASDGVTMSSREGGSPPQLVLTLGAS